MDYPPPIFTLDKNGEIVLNNRSYGNGIGYFDKIAIDYGYRIFTDRDKGSSTRLKTSRAAPFTARATSASFPATESTGMSGMPVDPSTEWELLLDLIAKAEDSGYVYLTDQDSGLDEGDWRSTPWDSGTDPIKALNLSLIVRAKALKKLGVRALPAGTPLSNMNEILPPIYLWHR
jgi:hypothetical protein